jgi:uncharacterized membrane protein YqiK
MIAMIYVLPVVLVALLLFLVRTAYKAGYAEGRQDQILADSKNFLRSVQRHEKNKVDEQ